ncbi:transcriptional regulator [Mycobacterium sp. CBMA 234]|uniref:PaaI family thioesterase n=1 Tax=Mycolicibacterium sp. CBMA 234 TaxID=1918495 RepID=UPI002814CB58|nr:PaaI family thioesterase [Mycolicibacterium sp. CBMA 234]MUL68049.1 transcriptional regulator [Mycolicibacterium sp. CBMA 234]
MSTVDDASPPLTTLKQLFAHLGLAEVDAPEGVLAMELPVTQAVVNTNGGLQGGLIATMADVAAGLLVSRTMAFGNGITTTDLHIRYLRRIDIGPARAVARIVHHGRRSAVVQVEILRGNGDLAATATVNFAALERRS